jgi:hypothetical protein
MEITGHESMIAAPDSLVVRTAESEGFVDKAKEN